MKYLLVNHVPFGAGLSPSNYNVSDLFLQDLDAQSRAVRAVGGEMTVATPYAASLDAQAGGSFNAIEIAPREHGFEYFPLPSFKSAREYFRERGELRERLTQAIASADVVQMDYGGPPFM